MLLYGWQQCRKKLKLYTRTKHRNLYHYHMEEKPLVTNGCTRSSMMVMTKWNCIVQDWWWNDMLIRYWLQWNIFSGSSTHNNQSSLVKVCSIWPTSRAVRCENYISSWRTWRRNLYTPTRSFCRNRKGKLGLQVEQISIRSQTSADVLV